MMTRPRPSAVLAIACCVLALAGLPAAAGAVTVFNFQGTATDIGIQRGPDQVGGVEFRLQGDFAYDGPIDLRHSTVTLFQLFAEMGNGGAGELIKTVNAANFLPITLGSSKNSQVDEALYQSPSAFRPQLRFQFERKAGDVWEFKLRLDRGLARQQPRLC